MYSQMIGPLVCGGRMGRMADVTLLNLFLLRLLTEHQGHPGPPKAKGETGSAVWGCRVLLNGSSAVSLPRS